jgi:hypothetical protein
MADELKFDGGFTGESWEYATAFSQSLGALPTSVTSVVRLLLSDFDKDPARLSEYGRFFVSRFLKSKTLQAAYYYLCQHLTPEKCPPPEEPFGSPELLKIFSGEEHAYLLSIIFYHRQARKYCDSALFEVVTNRLQEGLNLGGAIGLKLPAIGLGTGLLCGSLQFLGLFPLLRHDPDGFAKYLKHLRSQGLSIDWKVEFETWQCNSLQVGIMVLQRAGLGAARLSKIMRGLGTRSPILPDGPLESACRALDIWYQSIRNKRTIPAVPLPPKFYIASKDFDNIMQLGAKSSSGREATWLLRTKDDVNPKDTPQFFIERSQHPEGEQPLPAGMPDLPAELSSTLPQDTVNSLSEKLLQDILAVDSE